MEIEILKASNQTDADTWRQLCEAIPFCDIYFYPHYLSIYEHNGEGKACCFICKKNDENFIIYPFLKSAIHKLSFCQNLSSDYADMTSPYGYGGYLRSDRCSIPMSDFFHALQEYGRANKIISEFVRFHPWLKTQSGCELFVQTTFWDQVVAIDLTKSAERIWAEFDAKNRNRIRKSLVNGVVIRQDRTFEFLDDFGRIYYQTMDRNRAASYYYFNSRFFNDVIQTLQPNIALFHAFLKDRIIASVLLIYAKHFVHAHLSAADKEWLHVAPCNLLYYQTVLWAKNHGFKIFTLGGGRTSDPNDTLLRFKKRFSKSYADYFIGRKIHDQTMYNFVCRQWFQQHDKKIAPERTDFFPLYRQI